MSVKTGTNIKNLYSPQMKALVEEAAALIESSPSDCAAFYPSEDGFVYEVVPSNAEGAYSLRDLKLWQMRYQ